MLAAYRGSLAVRVLLLSAALPYFLASCVVPQATLLYWLANNGFYLAMQTALTNPKLAKAVGMPLLLVRPTSQDDIKGNYTDAYLCHTASDTLLADV